MWTNSTRKHTFRTTYMLNTSILKLYSSAFVMWDSTDTLAPCLRVSLFLTGHAPRRSMVGKLTHILAMPGITLWRTYIPNGLLRHFLVTVKSPTHYRCYVLSSTEVVSLLVYFTTKSLNPAGGDQVVICSRTLKMNKSDSEHSSHSLMLVKNSHCCLESTQLLRKDVRSFRLNTKPCAKWLPKSWRRQISFTHMRCQPLFPLSLISEESGSTTVSMFSKTNWPKLINQEKFLRTNFQSSTAL